MSATGSLLTNSYRGFSCPQEDFVDEYFETVAIEYARQATVRFIENHRRQLSEHASGLIETIDSWLESRIEVVETWSPIFGQLAEILAGRSALTPIEAAIRLALTLHEHGITGTWTASMQSGTSFRFGRWVLPPARRLSVRADGETLNIEAGTNDDHLRSISFKAHPQAWATSCDLVTYPELLMSEHRLTLVYLEPDYSPEFAFLQDEILPALSRPDIASRYQAALDTIRSTSPEYLAWIDRTMRYIIPLRGGSTGTITSGSTKTDPGTCHMSSGSNVIALAEMLIHEATHQYYHLLTRAAPVHDGTDATLYYSPVKRRGRPLPYILLAYHAFGNVLLYTRASLNAGLGESDGYLAANEAELLPQLLQLEDALRTTHALTDAGEALWRPISDRIHSGRL